MASRQFAQAAPRRGYPRSLGWWTALAAAMALTVAGCAGTGPPRPASPSSLPKTTLTACTVAGLPAECGNVRVPQDWAHPGGPTMPLRVVARAGSRLHSSGLRNDRLPGHVRPRPDPAPAPGVKGRSSAAFICSRLPGARCSPSPAPRASASHAASNHRLLASPSIAALSSPGEQRRAWQDLD